MDLDVDLNYFRGWSHNIKLVLSSLFDISMGTVSNEINKMRILFWDFNILIKLTGHLNKNGGV